MDTGSGIPESGSGVLSRLVVQSSPSAGTAVHALGLSGSVDVGASGVGSAPDATNDSAFIAINTACDSDGDGWSGAAEATIGTDPLDNCPDNAADNAWPADINNDGFSDISDIVALGASFGKSVPPAPARYNIAPDGRLRGHYRHRSVGVAFREGLRRHLRTRSEISPDQALRRTAGKGCWIKAVSRPTLSA